MTVDEHFMDMALELARGGRGGVEPNPMVGAVIVRDGVVIGKGYHRKFGGPHAEIEAIANAKSNGHDVRGATLYVTLEPCCHFGKTPPCTVALIAAGLAKVVAAMQDVDQRVAGNGLAKLKATGIDVVCGVLQAQARQMLAAYITLRTKSRPWVICKWAQTSDGYLALPGRQGRWISNEFSRQKVHQMRGLCQGILVGINTVLADDPLLNNRSGKGGQPARIVLDSHLRLPMDCELVKTARQSSVIVAASRQALEANAAHALALRDAGLELLPLDATPQGLDLPALLRDLGRRQWTYLLVEGGASILKSFISRQLADEIVIFRSQAKVLAKAEELKQLPRLDADALIAESGLEPAETLDIHGYTMMRFVRKM